LIRSAGIIDFRAAIVDLHRDSDSNMIERIGGTVYRD